MSYYVDENIKNTLRIFPEQGRYDYHRFDMNENPEGLPKSFVDSVLKEITPEFLSIYPEPDRFMFPAFPRKMCCQPMVRTWRSGIYWKPSGKRAKRL